MTVIYDSFNVAQLPNAATDIDIFPATSYFELCKELNIYSILCLHEKF